MSALQVARLAASLRVRVAEESLARHLPAPPCAIGRDLAEQVQHLVREQKLGYYPALEFLREHGGVDTTLLDLAEQVAWMATTLVRDEIQRKLRPVFAGVRFEALQCLAFVMPAVRPGQLNDSLLLAAHYTPNTVKADLQLSLFQRREPERTLEGAVGGMLRRWLEDSFETVEIAAVRLL